jgi:hypothetical protein
MNASGATANTRVAQKQPIQRASPTCSYCGAKGHTIRGCNSPNILLAIQKFEEMVHCSYPLEYITNWLHSLDITVLRLMGRGYACYAYAKYSKEECIDKLLHSISLKYNNLRQHTVYMYLGCLRSFNVVFNIMNRIPAENIPQLYRTYCANRVNVYPPDLFSVNPSDEECELLCHTLITNTVPEVVQPHIVRRFQSFTINTIRNLPDDENYDDDEEPPTPAHSSAIAITYEIDNVLVAEPVQLHCPICMETKETPNIVSTTCDHQFCKECMTTLMDSNKYHRQCCPLCREPIHKLFCGNL